MYKQNDSEETQTADVWRILRPVGIKHEGKKKLFTQQWLRGHKVQDVKKTHIEGNAIILTIYCMGCT